MSGPASSSNDERWIQAKWMPVFGHALLRPVFGVPAGRLFRGGFLLPVLRDDGVPLPAGVTHTRRPGQGWNKCHFGFA